MVADEATVGLMDACAGQGSRSKIGRPSGSFLIMVLSVLFLPIAAPFFIVLYFRDSHSSAVTALLIGVFAGVVAYGVDTSVIADIDRYTSSLSLYRSISIFEAPLFKFGYSSTDAYAYNVLAWIVAHLGNDHFLRSVICFVTYSLSTFVILDYGNTSNWSSSRTIVAIAAFVCLTPFFNELSYAKSSPAFAILLYALYRDLHLRRTGAVTVVSYLIAVLFHNSVLIVIAGRLLFYFFKSKPFPSCIASISIFPIATMLMSVFPDNLAHAPGFSVLYSALGKFSLYTSYQDVGWAAASQSSVLLMGYRYFFCGIAIVSAIAFFLKDKDRVCADKSLFLHFMPIWALLIVAISLMIQMDVFFRYAMPFSALFAIQCLSNSRGLTGVLLKGFLLMCCLIGLSVQILYFMSVSDVAVFSLNLLSGLLAAFV